MKTPDPSFNITYSAPDPQKINGSIKPPAYTGRPFPLRDLSDREFELLLYCLFSQEITYKKIQYDSIGLMSGVKERGQDCVLYINNLKKGIIQCKHSSIERKSNVKSICEEIIKFILYSIRDKALLPDKNDFEYYFASSSGFDTASLEFIQSFSSKIVKEKNLEKWTKNVIRNFAQLQMTYDEIKDELIDKLTYLKVKKITPDDIQDLLTTYKNTTTKRFFEVQIVIDNSEAQKISHDVKELRELFKGEAVSNDQLLSEFEEASVFLSSYKSSFSLSVPIKIHRDTTDAIIEWIKTPLKIGEDGILIIKGGAGLGKSVVLNNVYFSLTSENIPVIALKADEMNAVTIEKLEKKIGLSIPLKQAVETLSKEHLKVVVIIDQLDALSQSLSANRENLATYILLIQKLKSILNARVIVSVREYDLKYDPALLPLSKNTQYSVNPLKPDEIKGVLSILKVRKYSGKLIQLLSVPLHLELFCQVYNDKGDDIKLNSLYDLYNEIWRTKIDKRGLKANLKRTLYSLASQIYERQGGLSVNATIFDHSDISYLKAEGLLIENNRNEVMFFHQSFYDYSFARQFVESKKDTLDFLKENSQGLFVRSSLKIILAYLRDSNAKLYIQLLQSLLFNKDVRFHIKQLIVDFLGYIENPILLEKEFVETKFVGSAYEDIFLEALNSLQWVDFILEIGWVERSLTNSDISERNRMIQALCRNINSGFPIILGFFASKSDFNKYRDSITQVLYFLNTWNEDAIKLFEFLIKEENIQPYYYCHCLENAVLYDKDWVFAQLQEQLFLKSSLLSKTTYDFPIDHSEISLIKKLFEKFPDDAYRLCKVLVEEIIEKTKWEHTKGGFDEDGAFYFFSRDKANVHGDDELFYTYIESIERKALERPEEFRVLIKEYISSNYSSFLLFLIYGILSNPVKFYNEGFDIIQVVASKNGFIYNEKLSFYIRKLIGVIYPLLSFDQRKIINKLFLDIRADYELEVYIHPITGKKTRSTGLGYQQYKFLSAIPHKELKMFSDVYLRFQELHRKFGISKDNEPNVVRLRGSYAPIARDSYLKMTLKHWRQSFYKYNNDYQPERFAPRGGILEHCRAFEEQVKEHPNFFLSLLEDIVKDDTISVDYGIYGVNGLIKAKYAPSIVEDLIKHLIKRPLDRFNTLMIIWSTNYLINLVELDDDVFSFLTSNAIKHEDPQKDDKKDPLNRSINSVRGAAVDRLIKIKEKRFEGRIFSVLNSVIRKERTRAVKANLIANSAYLIALNEKRAFSIFNKLYKNDVELIDYAVGSANYFALKFFSRMTHFFENAINRKKVAEDLSNLLSKEFVKGNTGSEKFLYPLLAKNVSAKAEAVRVAVDSENLISADGTLSEACMILIKRSLNSSHSKVIHQYSISFLHFKPEDFDHLFPFLLIYSKSRVFRGSPAHFCEYITKSCKRSNAHKCFLLVSQLPSLSKSDISKSTFYDSEPLNLIIAIYNTLGNNKTDRLLKDKCMNTFDLMLRQPQHRSAANRATQLVDL